MCKIRKRTKFKSMDMVTYYGQIYYGHAIAAAALSTSDRSVTIFSLTFYDRSLLSPPTYKTLLDMLNY